MNLNQASLFEQFWAAYPARNGRPKVGKGLCEAKFKELDDADQQACITAAKAYAKASKPRPDDAFVPEPRDPIRFLKQDWWRDWVQPIAQQCQFRSLQSCENLALPDSDVCEFHAAYRIKMAKLKTQSS